MNIGGSEPTTILNLASAVQGAMGMSYPLRAVFNPYASLPGKYQDVRKRIPDTAKAREILGFEARIPLDEGLARTVDWHRVRREAALPEAAYG